MSQKLEMEELKEWIVHPTTLKFRQIIRKARERLLEDMSESYSNRDLTLAGFGGCEAFQRISDHISEGSKEDNLKNLLEIFYFNADKGVQNEK
jgi:hypothetical protein